MVRDALAALTKDDENLILRTFEIGSRPDGSGWGETPTLSMWLSEYANNEQLIEVAEHLRLPSLSVATSPTVLGVPGPLQLFASHLSSQRGFVGNVATYLRGLNIELFAAHDSIPMDAPWEADIVDALKGSHGGVAFIHADFHDSYYCMQEIGWMLGRDLPVARLLLGESPKGLLGGLQGRSLVNRQTEEVATAILDWVAKQPTLELHFAESLSCALESSPNFNRTDRIWNYLKAIRFPTGVQLERIVRAAEANDQVFSTGVGGFGGPQYRTVISQKVEEWDKSAEFSVRIATIRSTKPNEKI